MVSLMARAANLQQRFVEVLKPAEGLGPLLLRLYLAPILIQAGWTKLAGFEATAAWFGNPDWGLGLPFPGMLAFLAVGAELVGGLALVVGLATRWFAIPLIVIMLVAALAVHWPNGWLELTRFRGYLTLTEGGIHHAPIPSPISAGVPATAHQPGASRTDTRGAGQRV